MSIKDKITKDIKKRFREEIKKSDKSRKERGLLLCLNKNGEIYPTESSVESDNGNFINLKELKKSCPHKIQGDFHVHVNMGDAKNFIENFIPKEEILDNDIRNILLKTYKDNNLSITSPSHGDLLGTLLLKKKDDIVGTTCTSSDAYPDKIECWTAKDNIPKKYYDRTIEEIGNHSIINNPPQKWITDLFHKETIDLNK